MIRSTLGRRRGDFTIRSGGLPPVRLVPSLTQLQPDQGYFRLQSQLIGCFLKLESLEGGVPELYQHQRPALLLS